LGDKFLLSGLARGGPEKYMLAAHGQGFGPSIPLALISLSTGVAWNQGCKVHNVEKITQDEFDTIAGNSFPFTKYWDSYDQCSVKDIEPSNTMS